VFAVTCIFSIFAYIWLIIILIVVTPDYVDLWEAFLTFLMFPTMVILSYIADKDFCSRGPRKPSPEHLDLGRKKLINTLLVYRLEYYSTRFIVALSILYNKMVWRQDNLHMSLFWITYSIM
jgi:hypothetical protein